MHKLTMVRGKRQVFIGYFPSKYRANLVSVVLDWGKSWKASIETAKIKEEGAAK